MRGILGVAGAVVIWLCAGGSGHAGSWYVAVSAGGFLREDDAVETQYSRLIFRPPQAGAAVEVTPAGPPLARPPFSSVLTTKAVNRFAFAPGATIEGAIGYRLSPRFRVGAELGYAEYSVSALRPMAVNPAFPGLDGRLYQPRTGGNHRRITGSVSGFYDFPPIAGRVAPYLGVGFGEAASRASGGAYADAGGRRITLAGGSASDGFGLLEAGLTIPLARRLSLVPAYRFTRVFDRQREEAHLAKVGLRYEF